MTDLRGPRAELARASTERENDEQAVENLRSRLRRVSSEIANADRTGDVSRTAILHAERVEVERTLSNAISALTRSRAEADRAHATLVEGAIDPRRSTTTLDDRVPFLLLPLRLETRYVGNELWIRAFPDHVAITAHESGVTDDEASRGQEFWRAAWNADDDTRLVAWQRLVGGSDTTRAAWVARTMRPENTPPDPPRFPSVNAKASSWTTAPRSTVMPDQLVFSLYTGSELAHQVVGARIPSPLAVGPDPTIPISRDANGELVLDEASAWIVDFDRAVASGLGIRLRVSATERQFGFDRLVVVGVRISTDAVANARVLEKLLEEHRYTDGLAVVPQGTPTNHTDGTAPESTREKIEDAFSRELGPPKFAEGNDVAGRTDGERLAIALGVAPTSLDRVAHADCRDHVEAVAMNRALWPATLGYFTEQMLAPKITPATRAELRTLFTQHVTGRGALPALRVGRQPYGVLPTTALSRWQPASGEPALLGSLDSVMRRMHETWRSLAQNVSRAGTGTDPEHAIIDVLGLQPSSVTYHHRRAVGSQFIWNETAFAGGDPARRMEAHQAAAFSLIQALGHDLQGARAVALELLRSATENTRPTIDNRPLSETRSLDPNYIEWLRGSFDAVRTESYGAPTPTALLYVLLRQALLLGTWDASTRLLIAAGLADESDRVESELVHVGAAKELTRWDHLDATIPNVTGNLAVATFVRGPNGGDAAADLKEQLAALETLAPLPTARLERLFAEHVDLCSYRLDAWRLGLVARRLDAMRTAMRTGIHIGAYGWLEDLRPRTAEDSGGFVHAPSTAHAVTAAILRAAHLNHADPSSRERMSVDLRSTRVRRALGYLDGLRQGHELAALLGYRFERGLHDRSPLLGLEQHLVRLRDAFPLVAGRVHESTPGEAADAVQARHVVDGVRLLERRADGYPYGASGLPPATSLEGIAIIGEVDALADDMDAVADLLLAESTHQAAQGKHERANAVATGLARGIAPPEIEVVKTPRSGVAVTHRLCVLLSATPTGSSAWAASTPRSRFEPALDRWLGVVLGDPTTIRVRLAVNETSTELTAAQLGLQPIDLVYLCGADSRRLAPALERWIQRVVGDAIEIDWSERDPAWSSDVRTLYELAPLLASLHTLVRSRPAHAQDLTTDEVEGGHDVDELRSRLVAALTDLESSLAVPERRSQWTITTGTDRLAELHAQARSALEAAPADRALETYVDIARHLFGDQLNPLPRFSAANPGELAQAIGAQSLLAGTPSGALDEFIHGVARVRPNAAAYENALLLAPMLGGTIEEPRVAQLPHDPAARWLGVELASTTPRDGRALSLLVHATTGFAPDTPVVGLMLDEITDVVPNNEEITGLAYQQHRPASEPPQALLLIVPATLGNGWQWAELQQAVIDTFELAKTRAVEPDAIARTHYAQLLPAVLAPVANQHATLVANFERQP